VTLKQQKPVKMHFIIQKFHQIMLLTELPICKS